MICEKSDSASAKIAAAKLKEGKIVIIPTDTVYGFSGIVDLEGNPPFFTDDKIRTIKGRSEEKPFICLLSDVLELKSFTDDKIPQKVLSAWPGALTLIVKIKKNAPLAKKTPTLAFRIPGDEWLRRVIKLCGAPIYSTSVNRSGKSVLERISQIKSEFEAEANLIVQDGDKIGAKPSTLALLENGDVKIIRQGSVKL